MRKSIIQTVLFILIAFVSINSYAQEPVFSQYNLNPIIMNPSLAGINNQWSLYANLRQQWPSLTSKFLTNSISFDTPLNNSFSSSVSFLKNSEGEGFLTSEYFRSSVSHEIVKLKNINDLNFTIRIGMEYQYYRRYIDWSRLVFLDELHPIHGDIYSTSFIIPQEFTRTVNNNFNLGSIITLQNKEGNKSRLNKYLIIGASVHNMIKRSDAFIFNNYFIPRKYTIHGDFWWNKNSFKRLSIIKQSFFYQQQNVFRTLQIGLFETEFQSNPLIFGAFYRSQGILIDNDNDTFESLYFKVGFRHISKKYNLGIKICYSRDFTISELRNNTNGINELVLKIHSLRYGIFMNEEKERRKKITNNIKSSCQFYSDWDYNGNLHNGNFNPVIDKQSSDGLFRIKN